MRGDPPRGDTDRVTQRHRPGEFAEGTVLIEPGVSDDDDVRRDGVEECEHATGAGWQYMAERARRLARSGFCAASRAIPRKGLGPVVPRDKCRSGSRINEIEAGSASSSAMMTPGVG